MAKTIDDQDLDSIGHFEDRPAIARNLLSILRDGDHAQVEAGITGWPTVRGDARQDCSSALRDRVDFKVARLPANRPHTDTKASSRRVAVLQSGGGLRHTGTAVDRQELDSTWADRWSHDIDEDLAARRGVFEQVARNLGTDDRETRT